MAKKYIGKEDFVVKGVAVTAMFYKEDDIYTFTVSHVIKEANGNILKPGGGTSMDPTMEGLKFKLHSCYFSQADMLDGCEIVYNEDF